MCVRACVCVCTCICTSYACPSPAVMFSQPRYYRALNDYNPQFMSENAGREDEELGFLENDIIQARGCPCITCAIQMQCQCFVDQYPF